MADSKRLQITKDAVFITGMFRSGSTWSFNVVKELYRAIHPDRRLVAGWELPLETEAAELGLADVTVSKSHTCPGIEASLREYRVAVIHTFRDPCPALVSGRQAFPDMQDGLNLIARSMAVMELIRTVRHGCLIFYEDIISSPQRAIGSIAEHLELDASDDTIAAIGSRLQRENVRAFTDGLAVDRPQMEASRKLVNVGFSYYDSETLFHRSHISPGRDSTTTGVTEEERMALVERLRPYVDEHGRLLLRRSECYLRGERLS